MLSREDLKKITILSYLTDEMLDKILPIIEVLSFDEQDVVFKDGDPANRFFMVKRGKVLLELRVSEWATVFVGAVKPGFAFGWSAMLDGGNYTTDAVCAEETEVFAVEREQILSLIETDVEMGYRLTQRLLRVIKKRLDIRTEQFMRLIKKHPDMQHLL